MDCGSRESGLTACCEISLATMLLRAQRRTLREGPGLQIAEGETTSRTVLGGVDLWSLFTGSKAQCYQD